MDLKRDKWISQNDRQLDKNICRWVDREIDRYQY